MASGGGHLGGHVHSGGGGQSFGSSGNVGSSVSTSVGQVQSSVSSHSPFGHSSAVQAPAATTPTTTVSPSHLGHRVAPVNPSQQSVTTNNAVHSVAISAEPKMGLGSSPQQFGPTASISSPAHRLETAHHGNHGSHANHVTHGNHLGNPVSPFGNSNPGIAHHHFAGNTVQIGHQPVQLGSANYQPSYYRHPHHYHGYWNTNRGFGGNGLGYGSHHWRHGGGGFGYPIYAGYVGYGCNPYFWGMGGWGLGSLIYGSGYLGYSNPYYTNDFVYAGTGYNYSQPIPVSYNPATVVNSTVVGSLDREDALDSAVGAFRLHDYDGALNTVSNAISQQPDDAVLHEFRALILFAKGDYQQAAATLHSVLAVGPGWDWATMSHLYSDISVYTAQLRALESVVRQNPQDAAARFVLAYHYLTGGYSDAAARQWKQVVSLVPNDQVAAAMLRMASEQPATGTGQTGTDPSSLQALPTPQPPTTDSTYSDLPSPSIREAVAPVDVATILGTWTASRPDGSSFELRIADDNTFTWSFRPKGQAPQSFSGTYKLDGNVIALERTGGGSLVAEITGNDGSHFNFRMVGAPKEDPGLDFAQ